MSTRYGTSLNLSDSDKIFNLRDKFRQSTKISNLCLTKQSGSRVVESVHIVPKQCPSTCRRWQRSLVVRQKSAVRPECSGASPQGLCRVWSSSHPYGYLSGHSRKKLVLFLFQHRSLFSCILIERPFEICIIKHHSIIVLGTSHLHISHYFVCKEIRDPKDLSQPFASRGSLDNFLILSQSGCHYCTNFN